MSDTDRNDKNTFQVDVRLHKLGGKFSGHFPDFNRPEAIGFFSINGKREYEDNADNSSFLRLPHPSALPLDLNAGIDQVKRKKGDPDHLGIYHMCQFILNHQEHLTRSSSGQLKLPADFVTLRGILRQIMCTPYERNRDYRLMATIVNGTVYMSRLDTDEQLTPFHMDMCSWGFKFEQYCTAPLPDVAPITNTPVDESEEFSCVFRTKLNGLRLMYGAEMDCIKSDLYINLNDPQQLRSAEFVELKTSTYKMTFKQQRSFENYKSCNWWCQSFLVGIGTIIAGLRDSDGLVHDIKEYRVGEMHRNKPWSPAAMLTFLSNFLHELRSIMLRINDPSAVVVIDYKADKNKIVYSVLRGDDLTPVVPKWFKEMMRGTGQSSQ